MAYEIKDDGAPDYRIDSASSVVVIVPSDDTDLPDGPARGIWASDAGTINYVDGRGREVTGFPIFPGPNMIIVRRVKTGAVPPDMWAIY